MKRPPIIIVGILIVIALAAAAAYHIGVRLLQDQVIAAPSGQKNRRRLLLAAGAVAIAGAAFVLMKGWSGSEHSISAARLRVAEVTRGTLIRDAAVNGRIVAAVSPTLYSTSTSTVELKVHAGDTLWLAEGPDTPAGAPVRVVAANASVLVVERV